MMTDKPHIQLWTANIILQTLNENSQSLYDLGVRKIGLFGSYARGEHKPNFGSYARGDQKPESDMDFLVTLADHKFRTYSNVLDFLESIFACKIDLIIESGLKERLRPVIMKEIIYAAGL
jgi:uncharacterized protein